MIRKFRSGIWIDPDSVVAITPTMDRRYCVTVFSFGSIACHYIPDESGLADEIGEAALIAQEALHAAAHRFPKDSAGENE